MKNAFFLCLVWALLLSPAGGQDPNDSASSAPAIEEDGHKSGYTQKPAFGGPSSPEMLLEEVDRTIDPAFQFPNLGETLPPWLYAELPPWYDWKREIYVRHGLQFGGYYMNVYQKASDSLTDEDDAFGGKLRLTGTWTPYGRDTGNTGRLAVTLDHRHRYDTLANTQLSEQIGYLGLTQVVLTNGGFSVIHLNWAQAFRGGDAGIIIGRIDPNDYLDVLGYSSPWTGFATSTIQLNASQSFQESAWGILAGNWFNDNWYAIGGINDANGFAEDDLSFFRGGAEFFKQVEIGWAPSKAERLNRKIGLSYWHKDERDDLDKGFGHGLMFSAGWTFDEWTTFLRAGISEGDAPSYNRIISAGVLRGFENSSDQLGIGANWGDPSDESLLEQTSAETFYRFHLSQNLAITPSVQWINDPALNPEGGQYWVFGMRARFTF
ncbi:MAG: carbohydrate porin [Verrucomicrobiales bacterium]